VLQVVHEPEEQGGDGRRRDPYESAESDEAGVGHAWIIPGPI
jgi:hypothetical protein